MNQGNLEELLKIRDTLVAGQQDTLLIDSEHVIENEQIRELARIVTEMTDEETFVYSTT